MKSCFLSKMGNKADRDKRDYFANNIINDEAQLIKVRDFKLKTLRKKRLLDKKYDFLSRCHRQADKDAKSGDFGKAMEAE